MRKAGASGGTITSLCDSHVAIATVSVFIHMSTLALLHKVRRYTPITLGLIALGSICLRADVVQGVRITFNVPSDVAENSLKKFSAQSGREVLFDSDAVGRVTTNAVVGTYIPREALDRMLANTELLAIEDEKTGAFAVQRAVAQADPT